MQQQTPVPAFNPAQLAAQVDQTAQAAALDVARLRIEKWKADSAYKQQSQQSADSISRNLTSALPGLTAAVRATPQGMAANFKLYRNLNALYDVFKSLAESAEAFGPKQDYQSIGQYVNIFDDQRRALGDYLETLAAAKDTQSTNTASAVKRLPKKIIIDDTAPTPKKRRKKIVKKK